MAGLVIGGVHVSGRLSEIPLLTEWVAEEVLSPAHAEPYLIP